MKNNPYRMGIWFIVLFALGVGMWRAEISLARQSNASTPKALYQRALHEEEATGNLKAAIALYERVIAAKPDRVLAAQTLIHMADCYEKLGDAESRKIYAQVIRDYPDQNDATSIARSRLGGETATAAPGVVTRQVWPPATAPKKREFYGTVSADGRYIPYIDWEKDGNLIVHDLLNGTDRPITNTAQNGSKDIYAEEYSFSRDGNQLAYSWHTEPNHYELRLAAFQGSGVPQNRLLFGNPDVTWIGPHDWTPDGKWIVVSLTRRDRTAQICLVSVADGSLRTLKSVDWRGPSQMFLSPDGKYLAFDIPVSDTSQQRDVFLLALDGSRELPAVVNPANDVVMGWSPDGKYLLFTSDRAGSTGLWAIPIVDGRPQGKPELIKQDIGQALKMGITRSGALYFSKNSPLPDTTIQIASFDFTTERFTSAPIASPPSGAERDPEWSPDGKYLAYTSLRGGLGGTTALVIRSVDSGEVRELHPNMSVRTSVRWSPDGRSLLAGGIDFKGRSGIHLIDVQTGAVSPVAIAEDANGNPFLKTVPEWSADGKSVYYQQRRVGATADRPYGEWDFVVRDLASGIERELIRRSRLGDINRSPDGRYLATFAPGDETALNTEHVESAKTQILLLIPTDGGKPRELLRGNNSDALHVSMWAPDSQSIFVNKSVNGQRQLWRISVSGEAHKVDVDLNKYNFGGHPSVHPDGRRVAYVAQEGQTQSGIEIWVMENFLPALSAKK